MFKLAIKESLDRKFKRLQTKDKEMLRLIYLGFLTRPKLQHRSTALKLNTYNSMTAATHNSQLVTGLT